MKTFTSALLGTTALAFIALGAATPAQARGNVGVYASPYGFGVSVDTYRSYCRDYEYRHRYWDYCRRFYDNDDYYSNYRYYDNDDWRWRRRHHRHHDRDDWGGEGRRDWDDRHRHDGGEGEHHHHHDGGEGDRY